MCIFPTTKKKYKCVCHDAKHGFYVITVSSKYAKNEKKCLDTYNCI